MYENIRVAPGMSSGIVYIKFTLHDSLTLKILLNLLYDFFYFDEILINIDCTFQGNIFTNEI